MKYYKITNKEEKHRNMQYRTGLNINIEEFNPSGDCCKGGIYFTKEDILAFLDHGIYIREVVLIDKEPVYLNPGEPVKWKTNRLILKRRRKITTKIIQELICEGADVHAYSGQALRWAAMRGHLDVVKTLIEAGADVHADNNYALRWAAVRGHLDVVKTLIEAGADVHAYSDQALRLAADRGHLNIVKTLIETGKYETTKRLENIFGVNKFYEIL